MSIDAISSLAGSYGSATSKITSSQENSSDDFALLLKLMLEGSDEEKKRPQPVAQPQAYDQQAQAEPVPGADGMELSGINLTA